MQILYVKIRGGPIKISAVVSKQLQTGVLARTFRVWYIGDGIEGGQAMIDAMGCDFFVGNCGGKVGAIR